MSSSLLERARGFHEDLEIYERAIIEQLENKPRTQKVPVITRGTLLVALLLQDYIAREMPRVSVLVGVAVGCLLRGYGIFKSCVSALVG